MNGCPIHNMAQLALAVETSTEPYLEFQTRDFNGQEVVVVIKRANALADKEELHRMYAIASDRAAQLPALMEAEKTKQGTKQGHTQGTKAVDKLEVPSGHEETNPNPNPNQSQA